MFTQAIKVTLYILFCCVTPYAQADQSVREKERERLLEKIEKLNSSICEDPSKLCKKFISNNETSDEGFEYREQVLAKIRMVAESSYPKKLKDDGRYGAVIISFEIGRDGDLQKVSLLKKSNVGLMDEFAVNLIRLAAPFPAHEDVFSENIDTVVITDAMHFNIHNKGKNVEESN